MYSATCSRSLAVRINTVLGKVWLARWVAAIARWKPLIYQTRPLLKDVICRICNRFGPHRTVNPVLTINGLTNGRLLSGGPENF